MKTLIIGKNGQIARELQRSCGILGESVAVGSDLLDLTSADSISKVIRSHSPNFIINAGAYTAVDQAESERERAFLINGQALSVLGEEAKRLNAGVLHYSTDYVFDGAKRGSYLEDDVPCPLNVYGQSKLLGEKLLSESGAAYVILRVSWVYGNSGYNFLNTMMRLGAEREELKIVSDQIGAPTWARHIADVTVQVLTDRNFISKSGLYHLSPQGETSWFLFASKIFEICRRDHSFALKVRSLLPIASTEYPMAASRPQNSLMNSKKIKEVFGLSLPSWDHSLELVMQERFSR